MFVVVFLAAKNVSRLTALASTTELPAMLPCLYVSDVNICPPVIKHPISEKNVTGAPGLQKNYFTSNILCPSTLQMRGSKRIAVISNSLAVFNSHFETQINGISL